MAAIGKLTVEVKSVTRYCLIFFPIATFTKIADVELLTVFGIPVYGKVGDFKQILFWVILTDRKEEKTHD